MPGAVATKNAQRIVKRLRTLLKKVSYKQAADILADEGYRTHGGKRPSKLYVNYLVVRYRDELKGIASERRTRELRKLSSR